MFSESNLLFMLFGMPIIALVAPVIAAVLARRAWCRRSGPHARRALIAAVIAVSLCVVIGVVFGPLLVELARMYIGGLKQSL